MSADMGSAVSASVLQAFLPKFENEGQNSRIADAIVVQADSHYMVVTIKHSGSLITVSPTTVGAKNSLCNEFCAGGLVLLEVSATTSYCHSRCCLVTVRSLKFTVQDCESLQCILKLLIFLGVLLFSPYRSMKDSVIWHQMPVTLS